MSFNLQDLDRASRPLVHSEELDQYKFLKTKLDKIAVRIGLDDGETLQVTEGLSLPKYDTVLGAYPSTTTEVYTYSLASVDVAVVTVTYATDKKCELVSLVKVEP